jgi:GntR family transcriptional regulator
VAARSTTYGVLATSLREAILRGEYARGVRLPTEAELAALHSVSRQTVRRAMQDLVSEGLVFRIPGRGTYAVEESDRYLRHFGSVEELMSLSVDTECEIVLPLASRPDPSAAQRLELAGTDVWTVAFIRRHSTATFCYTHVALPPDIGAALAGVGELTHPGRRSTVTVIGLVDHERRIRDAEQDITATLAPPDVAVHLGCVPNAVALRIDRLYRDAADVPVELAVSHYDPNQFSYRVRLRRHPR